MKLQGGQGPKHAPSRRSILLRAVAGYLLLSALLRIGLVSRELGEVDLSPLPLLAMFSIGVWFDLAVVAWLGLPAGIYLWLMPDRWRASDLGRVLGSLGLFAFFSAVVFGFAAEWFFWDEFSVRFNFIAVDYLVYTTEVLGNIQESYPLPFLLAVVGFLGAVMTWLVVRSAPARALRSPEAGGTRLAQRTAWAVLGIVGLVTVSWLSNGQQRQYSSNNYNNEVAGNGTFQLFSAYLNNELEYPLFYRTMDQASLEGRLRGLVGGFGKDERGPTWHSAAKTNPELRKNVVFVAVESFSGEFLSTFGSTSNITPHLDELVSQSLFFDRLYATGTRTVRGLEALSLSIPPTPGQSIVRRPDHSDLFTIGTPFLARDYDVSFLYGGYGYFDNMNAFFADNGFRTIDRTDMEEDEIGFANIWGVADEFLFNRALDEADRTVDAGRNFFQLVLTTSNHRPFTYPDGRIDIPSPGGREGAVKYTDWAIGDFLDKARDRDWFEDTVFVIVADHCHASAGKTDLPVNRYHIPAWFYAPGFITPQHSEALTSQIDLAPTLLARLGFGDDTPFFGDDAIGLQHKQRAFVSTYQLLGLVEQDQLSILQPGKVADSFRIVDFDTGDVRSGVNEALVEDTITYYQGASYVYNHHLMSPTATPRLASVEP